MNRSHHKISTARTAGCIALMMYAASAAYASEHTDWPDFPDGRLLINRLQPDPSPVLRIQRDSKRRAGMTLDIEEHTDWPDFPDVDPSNLGISIEFPIPTDPNAMPIGPIAGQIPSLDDILNPFAPGSGLNDIGGIGTTDTPGLGLNITSAIPATGSVLLMLGLAAAATRRRR